MKTLEESMYYCSKMAEDNLIICVGKEAQIMRRNSGHLYKSDR